MVYPVPVRQQFQFSDNEFTDLIKSPFSVVGIFSASDQNVILKRLVK